jgi:hypothetical protein
MALHSSLPKTLEPVALLRVGLGLVLLYAGALSLVDTEVFSGFVPVWLGSLIPSGAFILGHGILSLALGVVLLVGIWVRGTALVVTLDIAAILLSYGIDETTFPLVGLMFASLALCMLVAEKKETATA